MSKEFKVFNLKLQLTTQGSAKGGHPTKTPNRTNILEVCEKCYVFSSSETAKSGNDDSNFVHSVAKEFGVALLGDANDICDAIRQPPWRPLGSGIRGGSLAIAAAANGSLVISAWKNPIRGKAGTVAIIAASSQGYFGTLGMQGSGSPAGGSGGGTGKTSLGNIHLVSGMSNASPTLFQALSGGLLDHSCYFAHIS